MWHEVRGGAIYYVLEGNILANHLPHSLINRMMETMQSTLGETVIGLFFHAQSRTFWLFLISAFVIAGVAALLRRGETLRPDQKLVSRTTWFSSSAINDYGLILGNALLMATLLAPLVPKIDLNIDILHNALSTIIPPLADETV